MSSQKEEELIPIKILYTGLDNAGKTSIILTLLRDFAKIPEVTPTRGVKRRDYNFLGLEISEWELGGQRVYRKAYLTNQADKVFGGTEIVIFLIDIQDKDRFDDALDYLNQIITQLRVLKLEPTIYVFFHKYDPVSIIGSQAEINNLSLELRNEIKSFNYPKFNFYRTSIYNLQTIIIAVSNILLSKNPKAVVLEKSLKDFSKRLDLESLELIDDNSLIAGSFYKNKQIEELMNNVTPYFLEVNEIFERASIRHPYKEEEEDEMMIRRFGKFFLFKKFQLRGESQQFYFLGCKKDSIFSQEDFEMSVNIIKEILG